MNLLWLSIFQPGAYKEMTRIKWGKGIFVFSLFFLVLSVISGSFLLKDINQDIALLEQNYDQKVPPFTFDGKELKVEQKESIDLTTDPNNKVIIDTLHEKPDVPTNTLSTLVFGKQSVYIYNRNNGLQEIEYTRLQLSPVDKAKVKQYLPYLRPVLITMIIAWEILTIFGRFLLITLFSLLVLLFASFGRISLSYKQAWLIAGFALVPAFLISFLNGFLNSSWLRLAFWVAVFTYIYHGVNSFKPASRE